MNQGESAESKPSASAEVELEPENSVVEDSSEVIDPSDTEVLQAAIIAAQFSGPLPPPEILQAYDEVVEGGASRIFDQWERETKHRQELERKAVDARISGFSRAQWMAFIVILTIGVGGLVIVALGHALAGFAGFFTALAAVAASFFRERLPRRDTSERDAESDQNDPN